MTKPAGRIVSPERQVLLLPKDGVLLSMPATAQDIAIHKLVNVCPGNGALGLPTIHGVVAAYDAPTGAPLVILDGPTVTGRGTTVPPAFPCWRSAGNTEFFNTIDPKQPSR